MFGDKVTFSGMAPFRRRHSMSEHQSLKMSLLQSIFNEFVDAFLLITAFRCL